MIRSLLRHLLALATTAAFCLAPAPASAQAGTARPPRLIEAPEPTYPADALAARKEGRVVLLLTIGVDGTVLEAEILESPGFGLGEAARDAARGARFEPALRDGVPVAARIRFSQDFVLPPGAVEGSLRLPGPSGLAAAGVEVGLLDETATARTTRTDAAGRFRFDGLRPGRYRVLAGSAAIGAAEATVTVEPGQTVTPALVLLPPDDQAALEVTVEGESEAEKLRGSAQAVHVVETRKDHRRTADLGEVLARTHGVSVRRDGGLGSEGRFALNGFEGDQVRFFLDGVPLHLAGYPFGLANVPVNLIERIEVYRGVVPMRFGADALGGAVNLVTDEVTAGTRGSASYQLGSFNTHRATVGASHLDDASGLFLGVAGFFDHADNDYTTRDAPMADERGRLWYEDAERFHDAYRAGGANVQAGWVDRPWARRFLLRGFVTDYTKELQHDALGHNAYGEVSYGGLTAGTSVRYEHELFDGVTVDLIGGFAWTEFRLTDLATCKYDWSGRCIAPRPAELGEGPRDDRRWDRTTFARLHLAWEVAPAHVLRFTTAPTLFERAGDNRRKPDESDDLRRELTTDTLVSGIEYEVDLLDDRLENVFFVKDYRQRLSASAERIGENVERSDERITGTGVGNALRYRLAQRLFAKASWEWATRMPSPDELFGDGVLTAENLELRPETSHNLNLGLTLDDRRTTLGTFRGDLNLFLREAKDLIALTFESTTRKHENVSSARALGIEAAGGWTSRDELLAVDANLTWLDFRNTSSEGTFGAHEGDRIPNQPWFFANAALRLRLDRLVDVEERVELAWDTRYVAEYFRGWESSGQLESKEVVPDQLVHTAAITWTTEAAHGSFALTGEVQNLGDAVVFDNLGTQRPGRAYFLKTTAAF